MAENKDLPHDLAEYVIEASAGARNGFWGCVAAGATFKSTGRKRTKPGRAVIARHRPEIVASEQLANTHMCAWHAGERTDVTRGAGSCLRAMATVESGRTTCVRMAEHGRQDRTGMTYTHGHEESVLRSHKWRTVENSAAYLAPFLVPGAAVLDVGCGPGTITADIASRVAPGKVVGIDAADDVIADARVATHRDSTTSSSRSATCTRWKVRTTSCTRIRFCSTCPIRSARCAVDAERVQAGRHRRRARQRLRRFPLVPA